MLGDYLKNAVQNHIFLNQPLSLSSNIYIGLSKTQPNANGTNITEPVGNGYSRLEMARSSIDFTSPVNGTVKNKIRKSFNESTGSWGTCTHYVIFDKSTGGNLLWYGELTYSRTIEADMQLFIKENDLVFTLE